MKNIEYISFEHFCIWYCLGLEWEKNETEGEIIDTTSILKTEIDISEIYLYEGGFLAFTIYHLVSMVRPSIKFHFGFSYRRLCYQKGINKYNAYIQVCLHGDQYSCVAYENNRWVMHFGNEQEVKSLDIFFVIHSIFDFSLLRFWKLNQVRCVGLKQVIGDWNSVLSIFAAQKIRPTILFYENVSAFDCKP